MSDTPDSMAPREPGQGSAWRLAVARGLAAVYATNPDVLAVLCGGSTGRGHADRWSDLEIGVLWRTLPEDAALAGLAADGGVQARRSWPYDAAERAVAEEYWSGGPAGSGLLVEVQHSTPADLTALLDDLLTGPGPDPFLLTVAAALAQGVPLYGDDALAGFRERVAVYPRAVAVAVVRRLGQIDHFWRWQMYAGRADMLGLRAHFADVAGRLGHVLLALNGRWWPGPKWLGRSLAGLPVAPAGLADGLRLGASAPADQAAAVLSGLVEATYELVGTHLPEADADRLREIFRFSRRPLDAPPAG
jgi:hypothetical protein